MEIIARGFKKVDEEFYLKTVRTDHVTIDMGVLVSADGFFCSVNVWVFEGNKFFALVSNSTSKLETEEEIITWFENHVEIK